MKILKIAILKDDFDEITFQSLINDDPSIEYLQKAKQDSSRIRYSKII